MLFFLAPTATVTRTKKDKPTGADIGQTVMTKHSNLLINFEAFCEKNRQHTFKLA
ncbi:hypothetical protein [Pectobacterium carotovorum]|uniref:hypothetical protein n=1 Tax=Pectobacterium carotovorum TaxID=554 RepID=UPI0021C3DBA0|nr:hypothetical protein [Pectobacterium carotovorum]